MGPGSERNSLLGGMTYSMNQASHDLERLGSNGLITRIPGKNRYRITATGLRCCDLLHQSP